MIEIGIVIAMTVVLVILQSAMYKMQQEINELHDAMARLLHDLDADGLVDVKNFDLYEYD